ncbi:aminotransferase-like domain-containing protein [Thalassiella azotivora]
MDVDLPLVLDDGSDVPLWRQVADGVRAAVDDGRLAPGQRVPSSRRLAAALGTSRIVVSTGYDQLHAEGYLVGRHGSGTYVAEGSPLRSAPPVDVVAPAATSRGRDAFDLGVRRPSPAGERAWRRALAAASREDPLTAFPAAGPEPARAAVAEHLRRTRGLAVGAGQVLLTAGTTAALGLVGRVLLGGARQRPRVAVENPGYGRGRSALADAGATCVPVAVDGGGLVVETVPEGVSAVLCSPAHQFPLGGRMRLDRRRELLERAAAERFWVVEDEYDGEFRYDVGPLPPLASLAADRVVHLGTTSQVLGHGSRLGWLVAPTDVVSTLAAGARAHEVAHPLLAAALGRFVRSGELDREVRRARRVHAAARGALVGVLSAHGLLVRGDEAGAHLVVDLPTGVSEDDARAAAAGCGITVRTIGDYTWSQESRRHAPALVLGYATRDLSVLVEDAEALCEVLRGMSSAGRVSAR